MVSLVEGHGVVEPRVESLSVGSIFLVEVVELQILELDVLDDQLDLGDLLVMGEVLEDRCLLEVVAGGLRWQLVLLVLLPDLLSLGDWVLSWSVSRSIYPI